MRVEKLKTCVCIHSGLVLSRKEARSPEETKGQYKRLNLRSLGSDGQLKRGELDYFMSNERFELKALTQEGDVIVKLFAPVTPVLIRCSDEGLVIPSQLAVLRMKEPHILLPAYLRWFLSLPEITEKLLSMEGIAYQRAVKVSALSELEIPIPEIQKQQQISIIYDAALKRKKLYNELVEQEDLYMNMQIRKLIGGISE